MRPVRHFFQTGISQIGRHDRTEQTLQNSVNQLMLDPIINSFKLKITVKVVSHSLRLNSESIF